MTMLQRGTRALILVLAMTGPAAAAQDAAEMRTVVEELLAGYEPVDPGPALRRLGAAAAEVLLVLCRDPKVPPLRRLRAIEALGHVPTAAGREYLLRLVLQRRSATDSLGVYELAAAARALGGFGPEMVPELAPLLQHESADVREGAATSLGQLRTREALQALRQRLVIESESGVRLVLARALRKETPSAPGSPGR